MYLHDNYNKIWHETCQLNRNLTIICTHLRYKNREKYALKKIIAQDNIYLVRQFAYIH